MHSRVATGIGVQADAAFHPGRVCSPPRAARHARWLEGRLRGGQLVLGAAVMQLVEIVSSPLRMARR